MSAEQSIKLQKKRVEQTLPAFWVQDCKNPEESAKGAGLDRKQTKQNTPWDTEVNSFHICRDKTVSLPQAICWAKDNYVELGKHMEFLCS